MPDRQTHNAAFSLASADHLVAVSRARMTVRGVLWIQTLANGLGAFIVTVYLRIIFPDTGTIGVGSGDIDIVVILAYLLGAILLSIPVNSMMLHRSLRWIDQQRMPTAFERWWVLTMPVLQTAMAFVVWVGAAVIFGIVYQNADNKFRVSAGIGIGGLITCCLIELLLDRYLRPVFAIALERARLPRWRREILTRVMMGWWLGSAVPLLAIGLAPNAIPELAPETAHKITLIVITAVVAGGLIMRGAAGAVSAPLNSVTDALNRIQAGDLDVKIDVTHIGEIGRLQQGVNDMVAGLRDRDRVRDLFGRQVGLDVQDVSDDGLPRLGGEAREITALFVDLDDFTAYTLDHTPEEVVAELNAFFAAVIEVIMGEGGWVNKFEGDAAMCIFGAPASHADHAARALRAAAALPGALAACPQQFRVGIGVATGVVVAGNIGTSERHEYTVIGDAVNVAARLTELAKHEYRGVLASSETLVAAGETGGRWREVGAPIILRGRNLPTHLFEPVALSLAEDDVS